MPQYARPSADIVTGSWTTTPLWSKLNEITPDDATFVSSVGDPVNDVFECALSKAVLPQSRVPAMLTLRLRRTAADPANPGWTLITLLQGSRVITSKLVQPQVSTSTFFTEQISVSQAEMQLIDDFSDLRVRVGAGVPVATGCSQCPVAPQKWKVSVRGITNGECTSCNSLNGDFTLDNTGGCGWTTSAGSECYPGGHPAWAVFFRSDNNTWILQAETRLAGLGPITYSLPAGSFRCLQSNTFQFDLDSGGCATFPNTLTLVPG